MSCPGILRAEDEDMSCRLPSFAAAAEGGRHRGDSGLEEKSIQTICSRSQLDSQRALCLPEPLMELQDVCPRWASTKLGLGGHFAEDCHCSSQRVLILRFALVEMAAGRLRSSSGTHCWAQESSEAARDAGSDAVGVGERGLLAVCQFLVALGRLGRVLVQLRNCLTFKMPSLIIMSFPDSADLNRKRAYLPSMWRDRGATPTSAWRLRTGVAL
jgi:hypothetical protein